jgi:hypothetical protein
MTTLFANSKVVTLVSAMAFALTLARPGNTFAAGTAVDEAFFDCLLSKGKDGSYTSSDGGASAVRLMGIACQAQWKKWHDQCMARGDTDSNCTLTAGGIAQTALKLLDK